MYKRLKNLQTWLLKVIGKSNEVSTFLSYIGIMDELNPQKVQFSFRCTQDGLSETVRRSETQSDHIKHKGKCSHVFNPHTPTV